MGVLDKLSSSLGLKHFSAGSASSRSSSKGNAGYVTGVQDSSVKTAVTATYVLPGSAVVLVSGQAMKTVASLQPGEKIFTADVVKGGAFIWASVEVVEAMPVASQPKMLELGLGETDTVFINAEQVLLMRDRNNKMTMETVRRLTAAQVRHDSVVMYNADDLHWRGNKAENAKKIRGIRVLREKPSAEGLYKVMVGSTSHALLVSDDLNSPIFLVVNSTNSTLDFKAVAKCARADKTQIKMKNTFIEMEDEVEKVTDVERKGIPRSYSDSDIQKLAIELELECGEACKDRKLFSDRFSPSNKEKGDLASSSNTASKTHSSTSTSSSMLKSAVSSESGNSISQVRVGTEAVIDERGRLTTNATGEIKFSDYESLPLDRAGLRLSAASGIHQDGRKSKCRKCMYQLV